MQIYNLDCIKVWTRYVEYFCQNHHLCDTTRILKFYQSGEFAVKLEHFLTVKNCIYTSSIFLKI